MKILAGKFQPAGETRQPHFIWIRYLSHAQTPSFPRAVKMSLSEKEVETFTAQFKKFDLDSNGR